MLNSARRFEEMRMLLMFSAMSSGELGSKKTAFFSPQISGRQEVLELATGMPHCMASSGGRPKPS